MSNYFRLTAYEPNKDITMILDSNGLFEKKWQFSAFVIQRGCKVISITDGDNMIDINVGKMEPNQKMFRLMTCTQGKAEEIQQPYNGTTYKAIKVGDKIYIPNRF